MPLTWSINRLFPVSPSQLWLVRACWYYDIIAINKLFNNWTCQKKKIHQNADISFTNSCGTWVCLTAVFCDMGSSNHNIQLKLIKANWSIFCFKAFYSEFCSVLYQNWTLIHLYQYPLWTSLPNSWNKNPISQLAVPTQQLVVPTQQLAVPTQQHSSPSAAVHYMPVSDVQS